MKIRIHEDIITGIANGAIAKIGSCGHAFRKVSPVVPAIDNCGWKITKLLHWKR